MIVSRNKRRRAVAVGLAGVVAAAGTAMAASNTVADRNAGAGSGQVAGFTVSDIEYFPAADPWLVGTIRFRIVRDINSAVVDSSNATVMVSLDDGDTYDSCAVSYGEATCTLADPVPFSIVESADVVAYDSAASGS